VVGNVPEKDIQFIRKDQKVNVIVSAYPHAIVPGTITYIGDVLDPATRTMRLRVTVVNPDRLLKPEMFATVWIESGTAQTGISVPEEAVQLLDQKPVVFIAIPDGNGGARFERRDVELGARTDGSIQILGGVKSGDLVVVNGAFAVKAEFARSSMAAG